mmetsp:Transcript_5830/g.14035  ORF Transcript_5830/g.14035 Transcript_5830/m.14035 type:complete len:82 (+) Transcript_5830:895-1140(+)
MLQVLLNKFNTANEKWRVTNQKPHETPHKTTLEDFLFSTMVVSSLGQHQQRPLRHRQFNLETQTPKETTVSMNKNTHCPLN